jgi:uncharacterized protein YkwD
MISNLFYTVLLVLSFLTNPSFEWKTPSNNEMLSNEERKLLLLVNEYRESRGLPSVPLSASLTKVAQVHAKDLTENHSHNRRCNMHSWSRGGEWTACCYRDNHKNPECMWDKPREIAGYNSNGYEIVYWHSHAVLAANALEVWKKSPGHHAVIANLGPFKDADWKAIGVGIYEGYATVWFGEMEDDTGR